MVRKPMQRFGLILLSFGLIASAFAKGDETSKNAEKILGVWKVAKLSEKPGDPPDMVFDFLKDKTFNMTMKLNGKEKTEKGTYAFDGETKVKLTVKTPDGKDDTGEMKIEKLTETVMILVDTKDKTRIELERVKKEKKEDKQ